MKTKINHTSWKSITLAVTASLLMGKVASAAPTQATITISLPIDTFSTSVPTSTVIIEPVTTTDINSTTTGGANYIGFQGDFTFDEMVVTFSNPPIRIAGLTGGGNWNVAGIVLPGAGPIRTL